MLAQTAGQTRSDVTLTGTARRIAGSTDESGTATLKALASGAARVDLTLPSGPRSEIRSASTGGSAGSWSGPDGISHRTTIHNLFTEPAWFFPAFAIARRLSDPNYVATYVGQETRNGQAVQHISVSRAAPFPDATGSPALAHLTQTEFFLDATTLLPAAVAFNTHPDKNMGLDIPVEICFSSYQTVGGLQTPFHVQQFLNNSLTLDLQLQSATFNSGLTPSTFSVAPPATAAQTSQAVSR